MKLSNHADPLYAVNKILRWKRISLEWAHPNCVPRAALIPVFVVCKCQITYVHVVDVYKGFDGAISSILMPLLLGMYTAWLVHVGVQSAKQRLVTHIPGGGYKGKVNKQTLLYGNFITQNIPVLFRNKFLIYRGLTSK